MIRLDSPALLSAIGEQAEQQSQLLRKVIQATTEQQALSPYISSVSSVQNDSETFQKSLVSVAAEKKQPPYLYTTIPPRAPGIVADIVKPGDFIYYTQPNVNHSDWDSAPIVLEKYKLVFFTIPKVGCTVWKQLFRRIMGYKDWKSQENGQPHDPAVNGIRYLSSYSLVQASRFMTDPTWTRAIMVRDPKTRFLSCFLDKAVSNDHVFIQDKCCRQNFACVQKAQNIPGFLNLVKVCNDGHWKRQHDRVDGKYWPYMDYILHVENAANDARKLLQHIGAWEEYGALGWAEVDISSSNNVTAGDGTRNKRKKSLAIFESKDIQGAGEHATHSEWKHWEWYTPESERDVEAFYRADYENPLFNFSHDCLTCITENETATSTITN
jgi:Sulfotransferase family